MGIQKLLFQAKSTVVKKLHFILHCLSREASFLQY